MVFYIIIAIVLAAAGYGIYHYKKSNSTPSGGSSLPGGSPNPRPVVKPD